MKIQFPNPEEYLHKEDLFFEQLELCIYHAKKAWTKVKNTYPKDSLEDYPWLAFRHTKEIENYLDEIDPNHKDRQEISLMIEEL